MLQSIRDAITGWLAYAVIIVLIIPFALWGIGDYLGVFGENYAVKVNDTEISMSRYRDAYTRSYSQMRDQFGANFRPELIDEARLRQRVIDELVNEELLHQYATRMGLRISDQRLVEEIRSIDAFLENGRFSPERYRFLLQMSGQSVSQFETQLRRALVLDQLQAAVSGTAFVPVQRFAEIIRLGDQRREFAWAEIVAASLVDADAISDERIAEYYERNRARYMTQETLDLDFIELSIAAVAREVTVDEEALRAFYAERQRAATAEEERRASHILLTTESRSEAEARELADDLRARIEAGESFDALAAEFSDDTDTAQDAGDLGWVERGVFVREFEDALYALEAGQVSRPVRTGFGWHIIRLDEVRSSGTALAPFEELREELATQYQQYEAERRFYSLTERLADLTFENPDSLLAAAESLGVSTGRVEGVSRAAGAGVAGDARVRNAAFSPDVLEQGYNSRLVELGADRVVVVRVAHRERPRQLSLEEVEFRVREAIVDEEGRRRAAEVGEEMLARAREGEDLRELALEFAAEWHSARAVGRSDFQIVPALLDAVFRAPRPSADGPVIRSQRIGNDYAVFQLYDVAPGSPEDLDEEQIAGIQRALTERVGMQEFAALLATLRAQARISYGTNLFQDDPF